MKRKKRGMRDRHSDGTQRFSKYAQKVARRDTPSQESDPVLTDAEPLNETVDEETGLLKGKGIVTRFLDIPNNAYGFISTPDGKTVFFRKYLLDGRYLLKRQEVSFTAKCAPLGWEAVSVTFL